MYGFDFRAAAAVGAGRARVDRDALRRCLEGIGCQQLPRDCSEAFVGLGGAGAPCNDDLECDGALHCERGDAACGACAADLSPGAPCRRDGECGPVLDWGSGPACVRASPLDIGACGVRVVVQSTNGQACGAQLDSPTQLTDRRCVPPLVCRGGACTADVLAAGEPCRPGGDRCASGLACGGVPSRCLPIAHLGEPCGTDAVCDPAEPIECLAGRCEPEPDEPGDACASFCAAGLRCIPFRFLCDVPSPLGGDCITDADCAEGRCGRTALCEASC